MATKTYSELLDDLESYNERTKVATATYESSLSSIQEAVDICQDAAGTVELTNAPGNINWDVSIPFNEGLEMERGYGNRDAFGNRSVDFSRASVATYINKSGQFKTATVDDDRIESDGLLIESASINYAINNNTPASWSVLNGSVTQDGDDFLEYGDSVSCIATGGALFRVYTHTTNRVPSNSGDKITLSFYIKESSTQEVRARFAGDSGFLADTIVNFVTGVKTGGGTIPFKVKKLLGGLFKVQFTYTAVSNDNVYSELYLAYGNGQVSNPPPGSSFFIMLPQCENLSFASSTIISGSTPTSRDPDILNVQWSNNGFSDMRTIIADVVLLGSYETSVDARRHVYSSQKAGVSSVYSNGYIYDRNDGGKYIATIEGNSGTDVDIELQFDPSEIPHRYSFILNDTGGVILGVDGEVSAPVQRSGFINFEALWIGSQYGTSRFLNGHLKNFRIIHRALSDEEIKALGGPS